VHEHYPIDFRHLCRQTSGCAHLKGIWWADILEGTSSNMSQKVKGISSVTNDVTGGNLPLF